jgi:hypothetical protein
VLSNVSSEYDMLWPSNPSLVEHANNNLVKNKYYRFQSPKNGIFGAHWFVVAYKKINLM